MRNYFSITVSDVHGSRTYSFKQFIKQFAKYLLLTVLLVLFVGGATIWWLNKQALEIENKRQQAEIEHKSLLLQQHEDYLLLDETKRNLQAEMGEIRIQLQTELDEKTKELEFLDSALQGLEDLLGQSAEENHLIEDRVKLVQLSTLEKSIAFELIPSGRPVKEFKGVTSSFGYRIHPIDKVRRFHYGIDYRGDIGDIVIATAEGVVESAGYRKASDFGNMIIITHANGFKTVYGHLNKSFVKRGQVIYKGMEIGEIGNTGRSSGPHLHYEIMFLQRKLDPVPFVLWNFENYEAIFTEVKRVPWGSLMQKIKNRVQKVEEQLLLRVAQSPES